jgi:hypothetical protein
MSVSEAATVDCLCQNAADILQQDEPDERNVLYLDAFDFWRALPASNRRARHALMKQARDRMPAYGYRLDCCVIG